jgi:hypothetical protein
MTMRKGRHKDKPAFQVFPPATAQAGKGDFEDSSAAADEAESARPPAPVQPSEEQRRAGAEDAPSVEDSPAVLEEGLAELREDVEAVLLAARQATERRKAAIEAEAAEWLQRANREAVELLATAARDADELRAQAAQDREEAQLAATRLLGEAQATAARLRREAEEEAERLLAEAAAAAHERGATVAREQEARDERLQHAEGRVRELATRLREVSSFLEEFVPSSGQEGLAREPQLDEFLRHETQAQPGREQSD